ncbi:hypothetical protein NKI89_24960 [Mesorhizobium sp. M0309]|uniref:hypothetical protein n=1 Tax=Mesorhizobium sp. M0309 TaxID=2956933 RepID=UPI003336A9DE
MAFTAFQTNAFQNNAFQTIFQVVPEAGDGFPAGGVYRRPIIYVDREGKRVDLHAHGKEPVVSEFIEALELSPQIQAALRALMPENRPPVIDLAAGLEEKMGRIMLDRELAAMLDDDALLALLLS